MSKIKLINGNTDKEILLIENESIDLIIADIPWGIDKIGIKNYDCLIDNFERILKNTGWMALIVNTGSCISAFIVYLHTLGILFQLKELSVFIDGDDSFGNIMFMQKGRGPFPCKQSVFYERKIEDIHDNAKSKDFFKYILDKCSITKDMVIIDPFMGSGNSAVVSYDLEAYYTGIEIDETYFKEAEKKIYEKSINN